MRRLATVLLLGLLAPLAAHAQTVFDVSLKEAFAVAPDSAAKLQARGTALTANEFARLTRSRYADVGTVDTLIRFTAVVLSNPRNSGLGTAGANPPNRVHFFVRDTTAAGDSDGLAGYGAQVVDGAWQANGVLNLAVGNVVEMTARVTYFNAVPQLTPSTIEIKALSYRDLGLPDAIVQPILVNLSDLNGPGLDDPNSDVPDAFINVATYPRFAQEYVRLEGLRVATNAAGLPSRFNVAFSNATGDNFLALSDISLRYRNDRNTDAGYRDAGFNVRATNYVPPAVGATVDVQGFTVFAPNDFVNLFNPNLHLSIVPFEDADVQALAGAPPSVANVSAPTGIVTGSVAVAITADAVPDATLAIQSVEVRYGPFGGTKQTVAAALVSGTRYQGEIPASALTDGTFVEYSVRVTDNTGQVTESPSRYFRVLANGIRRIAEIQTTPNGGVGASPFAGIKVLPGSGLMQIDAVVQTDFAATGFLAIQDDADLAPFSGIEVNTTADVSDVRTLRPGDRIRITGAKVFEASGLTRLDSLTFTVTSLGSPYRDKDMTTTQLVDPAVAEAHEGMILRLPFVTVVSTNPDAPAQFGEFTVRTMGGTGAVRINDLSRGFPDNFNERLTVGNTFTSIRGLWRFSNNNFKLEPGTLRDLDTIVANEGEELPDGFALGQSFPNPLAGTATIPYRLTAAGAARLDVFDALGRRVAVLVDAAMAPGEHTATLDASGLAAGLYVVRLAQDGQVTTRTVVVVK